MFRLCPPTGWETEKLTIQTRLVSGGYWLEALSYYWDVYNPTAACKLPMVLEYTTGAQKIYWGFLSHLSFFVSCQRSIDIIICRLSSQMSPWTFDAGQPVSPGWFPSVLAWLFNYPQNYIICRYREIMRKCYVALLFKMTQNFYFSLQKEKIHLLTCWFPSSPPSFM